MPTEEAALKRILNGTQEVVFVPYKPTWIEKCLLLLLLIYIFISSFQMFYGSIPSAKARENIVNNQVIECQILYNMVHEATNPSCEELIDEGYTIIEPN